MTFNAWAYDPMYPDYSKTIGKNVFNFILLFQNFQTSQNIDGEGNKIPLPEGDSFSKSDLDLILKFGALKNLDFGLGFKFRVNSSVQSGVKSTTYGEESFGVRSQWAFYRSEKFTLGMDLNLSWTFYKNTQGQKDENQLILGDPGTAININLLAGYGFTRIFGINGLIGWQQPPNHLSTEMLYDLALNIRFSYFLLTGGLGGTISLNNDIHSSHEDKTTSHGFNTGGSNLFYSFNRQVFVPYLGISALLWNFVKAEFMYAQNVSGRSTDAGALLGGKLLFNFGSGTKLIEKKERPPKGKMVEGIIVDFTAKNKYVKINLGTSKDIEKGKKVFFYRKTKIEDVLLARGIIYNVGVNWSVAKVSKYFRKENLKKGQLVRVLVD
jgi:hypothetical protein